MFYYDQVVLKGKLKSYFPNALSYHRFVELIPRSFIYFTAFIQSYCCVEGNGIYYLDLKKNDCLSYSSHSSKQSD